MVDEMDKWAQLFGRDTAKPKTPELVVNHTDKKPYTAFETQDKPLGFQVYCPSVNMGHTFFYHHLHTVTVHMPVYDFMCLTTNTSVIRIYGRHLQPLSTALGLHNCKSFTEFHPDWFLDPTDQNKPFIQKIEVALIRVAGDVQPGGASKKS